MYKSQDGLMIFLAILTFFLSILWIAIPFILISMNNKLGELVALAREARPPSAGGAENPKADGENVGADGIPW